MLTVLLVKKQVKITCISRSDQRSSHVHSCKHDVHFPRRHDKKATLKTQSSFSMFLIQLSSFNPAGLQAACANVHSPCTTVDFTFNASDVGIPDTVGSSMGMAYVVTEMSAFATNIAFCHDCTSSNYIRRLTDNISMITELNTFGK